MYNCTNTDTEDVSPLVLCRDAAPIVPIEMTYIWTIVGCLINQLAINATDPVPIMAIIWQ